jgi:hypothetical protein
VSIEFKLFGEIFPVDHAALSCGGRLNVCERRLPNQPIFVNHCHQFFRLNRRLSFTFFGEGRTNGDESGYTGPLRAGTALRCPW